MSFLLRLSSPAREQRTRRLLTTVLTCVLRECHYIFASISTLSLGGCLRLEASAGLPRRGNANRSSQKLLLCISLRIKKFFPSGRLSFLCTLFRGPGTGAGSTGKREHFFMRFSYGNKVLRSTEYFTHAVHPLFIHHSIVPKIACSKERYVSKNFMHARRHYFRG